MHKPHESFRIPSNTNIPIWRYMDFAKFVHMLDSRQLHFSRLDKMSDPFEGTLSLATNQPLKTWFQNGSHSPEEAQQHAEGILRLFSSAKLMSYVSCWHMNEYESVAMWDLYSNKGVAVQSTYARLCASFNTEEPVARVGEVDYKDYNKDGIDPSNTFTASVTKRKSFEHERELRAVILSLPGEARDHVDNEDSFEALGKTQPPGIYCSRGPGYFDCPSFGVAWSARMVQGFSR